MASRVLWVVLVAAMLGAAGGTYVLYEVRRSPAPPSDDGQVLGQVERDGIILEVWTARRDYAPGEMVTIFGRVRHEGTKTFEYATPTPCSPDLQFTVETAYGPLDVTYTTIGSIPCIQVIDGRALEPGATLQHNATWDLQIPLLGAPFLAPAGEYVITAAFPPGGWQENPLTVRMVIEVTGTSAAVVPQENATARALTLPEVQAWYVAHLGVHNVRQEDGVWYAKIAGEGWVRVEASFAAELMGSEPAIESRLVAQGDALRWEIRLLQKLGDPPYEMQVLLDAYTGDLVTLTTCEAACPTAGSA